VQSEVSLGLVAPRGVVEFSRLVRGNQESPARLVIGDGLMVNLTERLVNAVLECSTAWPASLRDAASWHHCTAPSGVGGPSLASAQSG
jgi:hypothetical protein